MGATRLLEFARWSVRSVYPYAAAGAILVTVVQGFLPLVTLVTSVGFVALFLGAGWYRFTRDEARNGVPSVGASRRRARPDWPPAGELLRHNRVLAVRLRGSGGRAHVLLIPPRGSRNHWVVIAEAPFWAKEQFPSVRVSPYPELLKMMTAEGIGFLRPSEYSERTIDALWPDFNVGAAQAESE